MQGTDKGICNTCVQGHCFDILMIVRVIPPFNISAIRLWYARAEGVFCYYESYKPLQRQY